MVHLTPISAVFNTYSKAKDFKIFFGLSEAKSSMIFFYFVNQTTLKSLLQLEGEIQSIKIQAKRKVKKIQILHFRICFEYSKDGDGPLEG